MLNGAFPQELPNLDRWMRMRSLRFALMFGVQLWEKQTGAVVHREKAPAAEEAVSANHTASQMVSAEGAGANCNY